MTRSNVTGTVTIGNVNFNLSGSEVPTVGDEYIVIDNDGTDPVILGAGAPAEGSIVGQLNGVNLQISYTAGDGNDVSLSVGLDLLVGVINGTVFDDFSGNGFDSGEEIAAARVELYQDDGDGTFERGIDDAIIVFVLTDSNGGYQFDNLAAGGYFVFQPAQTVGGTTLLQDQSGLITIAANATTFTQDFDNFEQADLSLTKTVNTISPSVGDNVTFTRHCE